MTVDRRIRAHMVVTIALALVAGCAPSGPPAAEVPTSTSYDDLVSLFDEWREFESPPAADGVHAYSAVAMAVQQAELRTYEARLAAIDRSGWPVTQQVDHMLVKAEMNGLDFDHRVRRPWARDPAFYVTIFPSQSDVPAHEGPVAHGWIAYIVGKIQLEQLMAERARQLGDDFTIAQFMDEVAAAGVIPVSLLRWELTGDDGDVRRMTAGW